LIKIGDVFDKKWGIKVTNPEFMLGILRKRYEMNNVLCTHLTQAQFLENLHISFSEHLPQSPRLCSTPFPPGTRLYIECEDASAEMMRGTKDKGYMRLTGALLWCARCTGPTVSYAVNQLRKVMSKPGPKAWEQVLHVLQCARENTHEGIACRSDGNPHPISCYDASFAPIPADGKCTHVYSTHLFGGPISWLSKELPHVGTHVGQNETAVQCFGGKHSVWVKYLIEGIKQQETNPTPLLGDNDQATRLSQEGMVTSGNKCYYTPHCWTKEVSNALTQTGRVDAKENAPDILTKAADKATCDKTHPCMTGHTGCKGAPFTFDPPLYQALVREQQPPNVSKREPFSCQRHLNPDTAPKYFRLPPPLLFPPSPPRFWCPPPDPANSGADTKMSSQARQFCLMIFFSIFFKFH
jgi:hypothetical protein